MIVSMRFLTSFPYPSRVSQLPAVSPTSWRHTKRMSPRQSWQLTYPTSRAYSWLLMSLRTEASLHKIFLVRRAQEDDVGSHPVVAVITPTVQSRLANKFQDLP
jgi:hypothetical protein